MESDYAEKNVTFIAKTVEKQIYDASECCCLFAHLWNLLCFIIAIELWSHHLNVHHSYQSLVLVCVHQYSLGL